MDAELINSFGLLLDIVGVCVLFGTDRRVLNSRSIQETLNGQQHGRRWAPVGVVLLVLGFLIQIIGNHV